MSLNTPAGAQPDPEGSLFAPELTYVGLDAATSEQAIRTLAQNFIKLPDGLDHRKHPAEIGVVTDALATPYKVLSRARIKPGETVTLNFCYSPSQDTAKDSTVQHWSSDIPEPFTHTKSWPR